MTTWEQRHNVYVPDDMKRFYLSTDGFSFNWSYQYSRKSAQDNEDVTTISSFSNLYPPAASDVRRVGYFNIPHLLQITLLRENLDSLQGSAQHLSTSPSSSHIPRTSTDTQSHPHCPLPNITGRTKIFEMSNICDLGKVCLVYESLDLCNLKVYLLELRTLKFTFLADSFSEYLRMTIVHLGLPYWELCFSSCGLPPWTEQLFLLLAPHLLERNEVRRNKICNPTAETEKSAAAAATTTTPCNVLDPAIFRNKKANAGTVKKG